MFCTIFMPHVISDVVASNHFSASRVCPPILSGVLMLNVCVCMLSGDSIYLLVGYINFITHIRNHITRHLSPKQQSSVLRSLAHSGSLSIFSRSPFAPSYRLHITMTHELHGFLILFFSFSPLIFFLSFSLVRCRWRRCWWKRQQRPKKHG